MFDVVISDQLDSVIALLGISSTELPAHLDKKSGKGSCFIIKYLCRSHYTAGAWCTRSVRENNVIKNIL